MIYEDGTIAADHQPADEEVRRYDKKRKKRVSNDDWVSPNDSESRITKMKDGTTHAAYQAEHVVDLESDLVLAVEIRPADHDDTQTLADSVIAAQINLEAAGSDSALRK